MGLTAIKVGAGWLSGSVGVLSEAVHSALDLMSAAVAYFTIREAGKKADTDHPFGHGKFETLSSLVESLLLVLAAGWILRESVQHLQHPEPIQHEALAMGVIGVSALASFVVYRQNSRAADLTDSSAIRVNALHYLADVLTSAGVFVALLAMKLTGWLWIDPLIGIAVAVYIVAVSWSQLRQSLSELLDTRLPEAEIQQIEGILATFEGKAHDLRTRKSGSTRHVDFHLEVCGDLTVTESHQICDQVEERILKDFPDTSVNIHVEPCDNHGPASCRTTCPVYQARRANKE